MSTRSSLNSINCPACTSFTTLAGTGGSEDDSSSGPLLLAMYAPLSGSNPLPKLAATSAEVMTGTPPADAKVVLVVRRHHSSTVNNGIELMAAATGMFPAAGGSDDGTIRGRNINVCIIKPSILSIHMQD